jgi:hypothetical protein
MVEPGCKFRDSWFWYYNRLLVSVVVSSCHKELGHFFACYCRELNQTRVSTFTQYIRLAMIFSWNGSPSYLEKIQYPPTFVFVGWLFSFVCIYGGIVGICGVR